MKKILSILLCMVLACQPFILSAEEKQAEETVSTDLLLAQQLGIMSAEFTDSAVMTRRDLANTFASILLGEATPGDVMPQQLFADCEDTDYGIYTVARAGLMKGVGDGLFAPEGIVTYNQMMKTVVAFLGYDREAIGHGGYPVGYLKTAARLKLTAGDTGGGEAKVTARKLASVLKLAQNVKLQYEMNGQLIQTEDNYLSAYRQIERKRGVITAVHASDAYSDDVMDYYDIKLDDEKIVLEEQAAAAKDLLGYKVDLYTRKGEGTSIARGVCFETLKNEVLTIESRSMLSAEGNTIHYYNDKDKEDRARFEKNVPVIYNGTVCTSYDASVLHPFRSYGVGAVNTSASPYLDGTVKLIDHNGDGMYDFVIIDAFDSFVVSANIDGKIYNKYRPSEVFDIVGLQDRDVEFTNILGQVIPVSYPDAGDIISASRDLSGNIKRLVLTVDTFIGEVERLDYEGEDIRTISFGETEFACSKSLPLSPEAAKVKPGMKVKVFFNKNSEISDIEVGNYIETKKGVLTGVAKDTGISDDYRIKIFSQSGEFVIAYPAGKVRYNDGDYIKAKDLYKILTSELDSTGRVKRRALIYSLNQDNKIDKITLSDDTVTTPNDVMYMYKGYDGVTARPRYKWETGSFGNELLINNSTAIFVIPPESSREADDDYYAVTPNYFETYSYTPLFKAYGTEAKSPVAKLLVIEGEYQTTIRDGVGFFIVDKVSKTVDADGNEQYKLVGFYEGKEKEFYVNEENMLSGLAQGDVITVEFEQNGRGKKLTLLFDADQSKLCTATNPSDTSFTASPRYMYGKVVYGDGTVITVETPDGTTRESYPLERFGFIEYNARAKNKPVIKVAAKDVILDEVRHPGNASMVFIYTWSANPQYMVIYNR